eukprot:scaffold7353_cov234-Pinguiococcus_pyrenoidosus.AAC.2
MAELILLPPMQMTKSAALTLAVLAQLCTLNSGFLHPVRRGGLSRTVQWRLQAQQESIDVESPFQSGTPTARDNSHLPLTLDNVELVLDEMRPYLMSDGGNVAVAEIDGPIVRLELQGACGTCPSSTMTMKMGLERRLKERIPEISEVVQAVPDAPELSEAGVESVLDGVRPFLQVAGGSITLQEISGVGGLQPMIVLKMEGSSATLQSVKVEIMQRLQRNFMVAGLRIVWE